jgi:drug/metabolite transporter (DMT)-like permease
MVNQTIEQQENVRVGIIAALALWVANAFIVPMVVWFTEFQRTEIMMLRGIVTAVAMWAIARLHGERVTLRTPGLLIALGNRCFDEALAEVGPNPPVIAFTAGPLVNILLVQRRGNRVPTYTYYCLAGLILGMAAALGPWEVQLTIKGVLLSLLVPVLVCVGFDRIGQIKGTNDYQVTFWLGLSICAVGTLVSLVRIGVPLTSQPWSVVLGAKMLGFCLVAGVGYLYCNATLFKSLRSDRASMLSAGENPIALGANGLLLSAHMSPVQWLGVAGSFSAASYAVWRSARDKRQAERARHTTSL